MLNHFPPGAAHEQERNGNSRLHHPGLRLPVHPLLDHLGSDPDPGGPHAPLLARRQESAPALAALPALLQRSGRNHLAVVSLAYASCATPHPTSRPGYARGDFLFKTSTGLMLQ